MLLNFSSLMAFVPVVHSLASPLTEIQPPAALAMPSSVVAGSVPSSSLSAQGPVLSSSSAMASAVVGSSLLSSSSSQLGFISMPSLPVLPTSVLITSTIISTVLSSSTSSAISSPSGPLVSTSTAPSATQSASYVGNYQAIGCYAEPPMGRALSPGFVANDSMTLEMCAASCAGIYQYFGVEYERECYCGNQIVRGTIAPSTDCNMPCMGNATEICGGAVRLSIYNSTIPIPLPPVPASPPMIDGYNYAGCYTEGANGTRALDAFTLYNYISMTNEMCGAFCLAQGTTMFGTEYGGECYCGSSLAMGSVLAPSTDCSMRCYGASAELCGAALRLSLYSNVVISSVILPTSTKETPSQLTTSKINGPISTSLSSAALSSSQINVTSTSFPQSVPTSLVKLLWSTSLQPSSVPIELSSSFVLKVSSSSAKLISSVKRTTLSSSTRTITASSAKLIASILSSKSSSVSLKSSAKPTSSLKSSSTLKTTASSAPHTSSTHTAVLSSGPPLVLAQPTTTPNTWASIGCFKHPAPIQTLTVISKQGDMSPEICISSAQAAILNPIPTSYLFVGVENGKTCYGATAVPTPIPTSLVGGKACTVPCRGNEGSMCGGRRMYNMYAPTAGVVGEGGPTAVAH